MLHITVDEQQAKLITEAAESIEIRDRIGKHLGYVAHGFSESDIAIAKERSQSALPRLTTQQVLNHLASLEPK